MRRLLTIITVLATSLGGAVTTAEPAENPIEAHVNDIYEEYDREEINGRYQGDRLTSVKRLVSNPPNLKLPIETFDLVLMVMTYHDIYYVSESNPVHPQMDRDHFCA